MLTGVVGDVESSLRKSPAYLAFKGRCLDKGQRD